MEKEFYSFVKECDNCGYKNTLRIKKGIKVNDFLKEGKDCFNCGCKLELEEEA
jgi:hypothetical protein